MLYLCILELVWHSFCWLILGICVHLILNLSPITTNYTFCFYTTMLPASSVQSINSHGANKKSNAHTISNESNATNKIWFSQRMWEFLWLRCCAMVLLRVHEWCAMIEPCDEKQKTKLQTMMGNWVCCSGKSSPLILVIPVSDKHSVNSNPMPLPLRVGDSLKRSVFCTRLPVRR